MNKFIVLILTILIVSNCKNNEAEPLDLKIRLSNISQYDYKNIVVNTTTGNVSFGDLNSGQTSEYKVFEFAYRYAFVEMDIEGSTYTLQPIDYVGESFLKNGNYTYEINANDSQDKYGKLSINLVKN